MQRRAATGLALALAVALLVVSGCGSSGSDTAKSSDPTTRSAAVKKKAAKTTGVLGRCTSVKGSSTQNPGLGHDPAPITEASPDTVPGATPNTISGCSSPAGVPPSATFTFDLKSSIPLICPAGLGGPVRPPSGLVIETGSTHIIWSSGQTTDGRVTIKTTSISNHLTVIIRFTSGLGFQTGYETEVTFTNAFEVTQPTFDCRTPGNPDPIRHIENSNVADAVLRRTIDKSSASPKNP